MLFTAEIECSSILECSDVREVACRACEFIWTPANLRTSEPCPSCGQRGWKRRRCEKCPHRRLEDWSETAAMDLARRALELDAWRDAGLPIDPERITVEELQALLILRDERRRAEDKAREKAEHEREIQSGRQAGAIRRAGL